MGAARVVAIGDLNASWSAWTTITQGLGLITESGGWSGADTHLIQLGDVFNRGPGARRYFQELPELQRQAAQAGGRITQLLGNHEVLTVLGVEAWCTADEYLAWATEEERAAWPGRVAERNSYLLAVPPPGIVLPLAPQLEAWKALNAPGRAAMRADLGPEGQVGALVRSLPLAVVDQGCLFTHAPLTPRWARLGLDGLNERVARAWQEAAPFYRALPRKGLFRATQGPLWNRQLAVKETTRERRQVARTLALLGVDRMVTGHTQTESLPGGSPGEILGRHQDRLWCIDVSLGAARPAALVIDDSGGWQWSPDGRWDLWAADGP